VEDNKADTDYKKLSTKELDKVLSSKNLKAGGSREAKITRIVEDGKVVHGNPKAKKGKSKETQEAVPRIDIGKHRFFEKHRRQLLHLPHLQQNKKLEEMFADMVGTTVRELADQGVGAKIESAVLLTPSSLKALGEKYEYIKYNTNTGMHIYMPRKEPSAHAKPSATENPSDKKSSKHVNEDDVSSVHTQPATSPAKETNGTTKAHTSTPAKAHCVPHCALCLDPLFLPCLLHGVFGTRRPLPGHSSSCRFSPSSSPSRPLSPPLPPLSSYRALCVMLRLWLHTHALFSLPPPSPLIYRGSVPCRPTRSSRRTSQSRTSSRST
jgi:hypothetical protein